MDRRALFVAACAVAPVGLVPAPVAACGGFFCSSSPIDQTGEVVVYGLEDDGTIWMSVQIEYAGFDDDFAWILPVPAPPSVSLGTDALFQALGAATVPTFTFDSVTVGTCRAHPACYTSSGDSLGGWGSYGGAGCGGSPAVSFDSGPRAFVPIPDRVDAAASIDAPRRDGGVEVVSTGTVGPYDTVVLGAASADEVLTWLGTHGYDIPASAGPLLDAYAVAGQYFVALRLSAQRTSDVLRPIVLRMSTSEACLPIRLTAIATVPDLPIAAIFLGPSRVVARNYALAEPVVSAADVSLFTGDLDWSTRVTEEVRRLGGRAFVTDFAGPTPSLRLELPAIDDLVGETDLAVVVQTLRARGYAADTAMAGLFDRFLTPAGSETVRDYVNCLAFSSVATCGAPGAVDLPGLVAAIEAEVTRPRAEATALVARHPYTTRLFTTMRAEDMTVDPVFVADPGLDDVTREHVATLRTLCSSEHFFEGAPREIDVAGETLPERSGTVASDRAYCASLGGVTYDETPMARSSSSSSSTPSTPSTSARPSTCRCAAMLRGGAWRGAVLLAAALAIPLRRARGRSRGVARG